MARGSPPPHPPQHCNVTVRIPGFILDPFLSFFLCSLARVITMSLSPPPASPPPRPHHHHHHHHTFYITSSSRSSITMIHTPQHHYHHTPSPSSPSSSFLLHHPFFSFLHNCHTLLHHNHSNPPHHHHHVLHHHHILQHYHHHHHHHHSFRITHYSPRSCITTTPINYTPITSQSPPSPPPGKESLLTKSINQSIHPSISILSPFFSVFVCLILATVFLISLFTFFYFFFLE